MGVPKGLLQSRTWWLNVAQMIAWGAGFTPTKYAAPLAFLSNVLMRLVTESPISGLWR